MSQHLLVPNMKYLAIFCLLLAGCSTLPRINLSTGTVSAPRDPGKPAEAKKSDTTTTVVVPAGSEVKSSPDGTTVVILKESTVLTQKTSTAQATTGTVDQETTKHRIDKEAETQEAKQRQLIGGALILIGVLLGFVLPQAFRWPLAGVLVGAIGIVLVAMPTPPAWLIPSLGAAAGMTILVYYLSKHQHQNPTN